MSQAYLIGVIVRLFSVYLFISTLRSVTTMFVQNPALELNRWTAIGLSTPLLAALLMWFFNLAIAKRLFYGGAHERTLELTGVVHLEQALFSTAGLWLVCLSLVDCTYWLIFLSMVNSEHWQAYYINRPEYLASMMASCIQVLLGIFLLFRAKGLIKLIARFRG